MATTTPMGSGIAIYFVQACFFGFLIDFEANTLFFIEIMLYIRRRQINAIRSFWV